MENQFNDIELFEGKSLSNIFEDIYTNHKSKKNQIKDLVASLTPLIENIGDATLLVPLIKEYLEIDVKNDDQLVKLAQIVQRMDNGKKSLGDDVFNFEELQKLVAEDQQLTKDIEKVPSSLMN